ncbi:uncharacterized protein LOC142363415 [Opisthocomus hoazin]|uniref:uncharacterized protein LOC142363415 n=1 Tax=Opisthocomus hoazin TaxID=30419 RepID=UPI003F5361EB
MAAGPAALSARGGGPGVAAGPCEGRSGVAGSALRRALIPGEAVAVPIPGPGEALAQAAPEDPGGVGQPLSPQPGSPPQLPARPWAIAARGPRPCLPPHPVPGLALTGSPVPTGLCQPRLPSKHRAQPARRAMGSAQPLTDERWKETLNRDAEITAVCFSNDVKVCKIPRIHIQRAPSNNCAPGCLPQNYCFLHEQDGFIRKGEGQILYF